MSKQKHNGSSDRLQEIISRVDSSNNTNCLKLLEPPQPVQQLPVKK